jgi:DNA-binding transcriptional LysR family regulator
MANALPDLKLLRIFVSVVRHQGFANAQQELNLSTSAISTYMSQLEAALGLVLCHRGRGGFSLTSKGELFHQETLRLLAELEGFEQYAAALKGELRGTLNLGVIDSTVSDKALPFAEAIGAYSQEHPAVHLHLSVMSPYELQLGVQDNRLDLAIGAFSTRMSGLVYMPLYREQHWLYCSSGIRCSTNGASPSRSSPSSAWSDAATGARPNWPATVSNIAPRPWKVWRRS